MPHDGGHEILARYSRGNLLVGLALAAAFTVMCIWGIGAAPGFRRYIPGLSEAFMFAGSVFSGAATLWIAAFITRVAIHGRAAIIWSDGVMEVSAFMSRRFPLNEIRQVEIHLANLPWGYSFPRWLSVHTWSKKPVSLPAFFFRAPIKELVPRLEALGIKVVERRQQVEVIPR